MIGWNALSGLAIPLIGRLLRTCQTCW